MPKPRIAFVCQSCGASTPKWAGQCPDCGEWNTLVEAPVRGAGSGRGARGWAGTASPVMRLTEVAQAEAPRIPTGIAEFDRVLGGGIVPGAVILIGGDPGIGKSTLLLQVLAALGERMRCLYVTGEESLAQVRMRADRLKLSVMDLPVLAETSVERVLEAVAREQPGLLVCDSIQTLCTETLDSTPGSVSQLRESAAQLVRHAKTSGCAIVLVGHVTKEGAIAGPRVLEHMVDTVLYFEHDTGQRFRIVRAVKNRFGAVNELGVFAMTDGGLKEVGNPSALFLSGHSRDVPGSVITVTRQGSRPLLVEVQALVDDSQLSNPRRVALGLDGNRLAMLLAVLHRHGGVSLAGYDVFVNVVGGMRIGETAADLPLVLAALSSLRGTPLPEGTVVFGELGLAGEIRPVQGGQERIHEAAKHGLRRAIVPKANAPRRARESIEIIGVERLAEAIDACQ